MSSADLERERRYLRDRVAELERELRKIRDEVRVARERKVEEIDEGVSLEETVHQNHSKKEETSDPGLIKHETKEEVKHQIKLERLKPICDPASPDPIRGESAVQSLRAPGPTHSQGDDDDVIIVDSPRRPQGKRKGRDDQPSPRPPKQQTFGVGVPPRRKKKVPSVPTKLE